MSIKFSGYLDIIDNYKTEEFKLNLKKTYQQIKEEIDPAAQATANSILLMNKLRSNPQFMGMLQQIKLPTDKYTAILKFAELLGITQPRFTAFIQSAENMQSKPVSEPNTDVQ